MKDCTTQQLLEELEESKNLLEDALYLFTTGSDDVSMKKIDQRFKAMKQTMKQLRSIAKELYND